MQLLLLLTHRFLRKYRNKTFVNTFRIIAIMNQVTHFLRVATSFWPPPVWRHVIQANLAQPPPPPAKKSAPVYAYGYRGLNSLISYQFHTTFSIITVSPQHLEWTVEPFERACTYVTLRMPLPSSQPVNCIFWPTSMISWSVPASKLHKHIKGAALHCWVTLLSFSYTVVFLGLLYAIMQWSISTVLIVVYLLLG